MTTKDQTSEPMTEMTAEEIAEAMAAELGAEPKVADGAVDAAPVTEAFIEEKLPSELDDIQAKSILESVLFASHHPTSFAALKTLFHGTNINSEKLWDVLHLLQTDYAGGERGITLEEVAGGYQLRTKIDNGGWLKKLVKGRPFRLSGPALEVLSIIAYKQPCIKSEVDEIRGVESGHLVRALMEKNMVRFAGKSELPGKPMLYATTKNFLELFGLRNIRELPTLSEIDKLIPEGIGDFDDVTGGETLGSLADKIAIDPGKSYSDSENELLSITESLGGIETTTDFFEKEKIRERERRDQERAQDLRERMIIGETLNDVDGKWLARYEAKVAAAAQAAAEANSTPTATDIEPEPKPTEETTAVAVAQIATDMAEYENTTVDIEASEKEAASELDN